MPRSRYYIDGIQRKKLPVAMNFNFTISPLTQASVWSQNFKMTVRGPRQRMATGSGCKFRLHQTQRVGKRQDAMWDALQAHLQGALADARARAARVALARAELSPHRR